MKHLYLVDYWVPFPASEYGGLVSVVADDDNECHDLLLDWREDYLSEYDSRIMERVVNATKFSLLEMQESRIVDNFTT
jgi:hypothetical protein